MKEVRVVTEKKLKKHEANGWKIVGEEPSRGSSRSPLYRMEREVPQDDGVKRDEKGHKIVVPKKKKPALRQYK